MPVSAPPPIIPITIAPRAAQHRQDEHEHGDEDGRLRAGDALARHRLDVDLRWIRRDLRRWRDELGLRRLVRHDRAGYGGGRRAEGFGAGRVPVEGSVFVRVHARQCDASCPADHRMIGYFGGGSCAT